MNLISLFFLRRAPGPRRSPMRPMGLLSLFLSRCGPPRAPGFSSMSGRRSAFTPAPTSPGPTAPRAAGPASASQKPTTSCGRSPGSPPVPCAKLCGEAPRPWRRPRLAASFGGGWESCGRRSSGTTGVRGTAATSSIRSRSPTSAMASCTSRCGPSYTPSSSVGGLGLCYPSIYGGS